jgi:hypothetical protein
MGIQFDCLPEGSSTDHTQPLGKDRKPDRAQGLYRFSITYGGEVEVNLTKIETGVNVQPDGQFCFFF